MDPVSLETYRKEYREESKALLRSRPSPFLLRFLIRTYPAWLGSLEAGSGPLRDEKPWITYAARAWLERYVAPGMNVFEYGAGGSTLFFAGRVRAVTSVEHDPEWAARVRDALSSKGCPGAVVLDRPPVPDPRAVGQDPADMDACVSIAPEFAGFTFRDYVSAIDAFPEDHFDLVVIDGRARPACFARAWARVRPGGCILWDNTERAHYAAAMARAPAGFKVRHFPGPTPYIRYFTRTSVWRRSPRKAARAAAC